MTQAHTRDFSRKRPPVYFTIDEVRYDCYKALDLEQLRRFAMLAQGLGSFVRDVQDDEEATVESASLASAAIDKILELMKIVMKKHSYMLFSIKVKPADDDREYEDFEPVDPIQLMEIVKWLMGIYTARPSQPSSNSSGGSAGDDGGTPSAAGASPAESIPADSPPTVYAIS